MRFEDKSLEEAYSLEIKTGTLYHEYGDEQAETIVFCKFVFQMVCRKSPIRQISEELLVIVSLKKIMH